LVLVHGILHLLGYDHEKSDKEAKKMREKEKEHLKQTLNFKL
jgi:probable rRNA maturation factor